MKFVLGANDMMVLLPFMTGGPSETFAAATKYMVAMGLLVGGAVLIAEALSYFLSSVGDESAEEKWISFASGCVLCVYAAYIFYDEQYGDDDDDSGDSEQTTEKVDAPAISVEEPRSAQGKTKLLATRRLSRSMSKIEYEIPHEVLARFYFSSCQILIYSSRTKRTLRLAFENSKNTDRFGLTLRQPSHESPL